MRETRWGETVKRRVITWLQNHRRSRHERQINFPELCMDNSIAIWRTSFDICSTIGITICMREYDDYNDNFCWSGAIDVY